MTMTTGEDPHTIRFAPIIIHKTKDVESDCNDQKANKNKASVMECTS